MFSVVLLLFALFVCVFVCLCYTSVCVVGASACGLVYDRVCVFSLGGMLVCVFYTRVCCVLGV